MELLSSMPTAGKGLIAILNRVGNVSTGFWERKGQLQSYLDFLLCGLDPLFSKRRMAAEVVGIKNETAETSTIVLRPPARWTGFTAGQFIAVDAEIGGITYRRNYSLSCSPEFFQKTGKLTITVKAIDDGKVSSFINRNLTMGMVVHISHAMGHFCLPDQTDDDSISSPVFIAGGSGITPIRSMINSLFNGTDSNAGDVLLIHHAKNSSDIIFKNYFEELAKQFDQFTYIKHYSDDEGYIGPEQLKQDCPDIKRKSVYMCGPEAFMESAAEIAQVLSVPKTSIYSESFGGSNRGGEASLLKPDVLEPGTVKFLFVDRQVHSDGQSSLLELAEQAGLSPKYGCRNGICHECKCQRPQGQVFNRMTGQLIPEDQTQIQSCISVPSGNVTLNNW